MKSKPLFVLAGALLFGTAFSNAPSVTPIQQLFVMKEIKPDVERVGVIWADDDGVQAELMPQLQKAGAGAGVTVFTADVNGLSDVAAAYRGLVRDNNIQVLWILTNDNVVASKNARKFLIKSTLEAGIPLLAPSDDWVDEGAPVSFKRGAEGVELVVNKAAAEALSLSFPEKYLARTQFLAQN